MHRANPSCLLAVIGMLPLLCTACTFSTVQETHYFAAYGPDGATNFYRVRVRAQTRNSENEFRAGEFPADAVDAVFGEVDEDTDPQAQTDLLRKAVNGTARRYGRLLASGRASDGDIDAAEARYKKALAALDDHLAKQSASTKIAKKFVFVYSTDPSKAIQSIKDYLERQKLAKTLANVFQASVVKEAALAKEELDAVSARRAARSALLTGTLGQLDDALPALESPHDAEGAAVLRNEVSGMARFLKAADEGVR